MASRAPIAVLQEAYLEGARDAALSAYLSDAVVRSGVPTGTPDAVLLPILARAGSARIASDAREATLQASQHEVEARQAWRESCGLAKPGEAVSAPVSGPGARARIGWSYSQDLSEPLDHSQAGAHGYPRPDARLDHLDRASMAQLGVKVPSKRKVRALARLNRKA